MSARGNHGATLQAVARPILWELWKSTQETVNLAVLDQGTVLLTAMADREPAQNSGSHRAWARAARLHVTALGKAVAAFLPAEDREKIF